LCLKYTSPVWVLCAKQLKLSMSTRVLGSLIFDIDAYVKRKVGRMHWSFQHCITSSTRQVDRGAPVMWPTRSPGLNPPGFAFWRSRKIIVYTPSVNSFAKLQDAVEDRRNLFRIRPRTFDQVRQTLRKCGYACVSAQGQNLIIYFFFTLGHNCKP
jgi:hypothetical protein